jgi:type I restriction enzyme, S subunit
LGIASPVGEEPLCLGQRVMILRPKEEVDSSYLMWSMNHPCFYRRVIRGLGATTSPHVNVGDIKNILTPIPSLEEQKKIGQTLNNALHKIVTERNFRDKLNMQKLGLMHNLLTGKVEVKIQKSEAANV